MTILQHQLEACQESALKIAHEEAMDCRNVEDLVSVAVSLFNSIKTSVARWKVHVPRESDAREMEEARAYSQAFERAGSLFATLFELIERLEHRGFAVEGIAEMRAAARELDAVRSVSFERMQKSVSEFNAGQSRPLAEVMGELRSRHHT